MTKAEIADQMHNSKYNCAQAVVCAFSDEIGVDRKTLFRIAEGFGFGGGCAAGMCGALTGGLMLLGLKNSDGNLEDPKSKKETYKIAKQMKARFEEKTGGLICKDLKGMETGKMLCSCPDCIKNGVEVVQEILEL